jgi:hypothetical protein
MKPVWRRFIVHPRMLGLRDSAQYPERSSDRADVLQRRGAASQSAFRSEDRPHTYRSRYSRGKPAAKAYCRRPAVVHTVVIPSWLRVIEMLFDTSKVTPMPTPRCSWITVPCSCWMVVGFVSVSEPVSHDEIHHVPRREVLILFFAESTHHERKIIGGTSGPVPSDDLDRFR